AGIVSTSNLGKIKVIDNESGHYLPGVVQMIQVVEELFKQGALLDTELVHQYQDEENGELKTEPVDPESKEGKLYERIMAIQAHLMEKLAKDGNANISKELEVIKLAKVQLAKWGYSPSNKTSDSVVQFLQIKEGMSGADVKEGKVEPEKTVLGVEEFLTTGGGNQDQSLNKVALHEELERKLEKRREALDMEAQERAKSMGMEHGIQATHTLEEVEQELDFHKQGLEEFKRSEVKPELFDDIAKQVSFSREELDKLAKQQHDEGKPFLYQDLARSLDLEAKVLRHRLFSDDPEAFSEMG